MKVASRVVLGTFDEETANELYASGEWTQPEWSERSGGWKMCRLKGSMKARREA